MHSASVYAILAVVAAPLVSAAAIDVRQLPSLSSKTLPAAPYESLSAQQMKDFGIDFDNYKDFDNRTDLFKCHGTCGSIRQMHEDGVIKAGCDDKLFVDSLEYCMNCTVADPTAFYSSAKKTAEDCHYVNVRVGGKIEKSAVNPGTVSDQSPPEPTGEKDGSSQTKQAQPASDGSATSGTASQSEGVASKTPAGTTQTGAASAAPTATGKPTAAPTPGSRTVSVNGGVSNRLDLATAVLFPALAMLAL